MLWVSKTISRACWTIWCTFCKHRMNIFGIYMPGKWTFQVTKIDEKSNIFKFSKISCRIDEFMWWVIRATKLDVCGQKAYCGYLKASPDLAEYIAIHFGGIEWIYLELTRQENRLFKWQKSAKFWKFWRMVKFQLWISNFIVGGMGPVDHLVALLSERSGYPKVSTKSPE